MKKAMIFIHVPAYGIEHKFFADFFSTSIVEASEAVVFFYISKMAFCLYGTYLSFDDALLALDIFTSLFF